MEYIGRGWGTLNWPSGVGVRHLTVEFETATWAFLKVR